MISNLEGYYYSKGLKNLSFSLWIINFLLIFQMLNYGDLFWVVMFWQILLILPICIGIYYLISKLNKGEKDLKSLDINLKRYQFIFLSTICIICFPLIGWSINENNQIVAKVHEQLMNELAQITDPTQLLINKTNTPSTLLEILRDIDEIKDGEVKVTTLPWKSTVQVITITNDSKGTITREFTYVRFNKEWRLDGMYRKSISFN